MTIEERLGDLEAKARGATPGPWHTEEPHALGVGWGRGAICIVHGLPAPPQSYRNAAFIAAAHPGTVLALIEVARAAMRANDGVHGGREALAVALAALDGKEAETP